MIGKITNIQIMRLRYYDYVYIEVDCAALEASPKWTYLGTLIVDIPIP
jgi:hypothetical protein